MDQTPFQFVHYGPSSFQNDFNFQAINNHTQTYHPKNLNERETTENESDCESIPNSKVWSYHETKALLSFLAENFDLYRKNKPRFYAKAAINLGNNRTSAQVNSRIQILRSKYEVEIKEETGKARSKWQYLDEMNELFGNRENVKPDYVVSSIDKYAESDDEDCIILNDKKRKKRKITDTDQMYLDELSLLRNTKKLTLDIAQERLEIEKRDF